MAIDLTDNDMDGSEEEKELSVYDPFDGIAGY